MKTTFMILGLLFGTSISFFSSTPALAGRTVSIPSIQVQKTGNYLGQYATIYYGFEQTTIIHADTSLVSLSTIRTSKTLPITGDNVVFPAVQIDKEGIRGAYDIIVVVISHYPNFTWKNADGSIPVGILDTKIYETSFISFHKDSEIEAYRIQNPTAAMYPWPLTISGSFK